MPCHAGQRIQTFPLICVPGSKAECVRRLEGGSVTRFNPKHDYPQGCTDYERWKRAQVQQGPACCAAP